ncbi:hypothetical protein DPEC_G00288570 [Dallia pectoralis]|uniref:Uncharacterized protein n=1 Tax=Dallia pectoralis TaxID=75939 RepID=A0ACC2FKR6_DALPE|nr:hypothetical protein DPEC_G00288570 [Dallia pectoralis]
MEQNKSFWSKFKSVFLNLIGPGFFLFDMVVDVWSVVSLYQQEAYIFLGPFVVILLGSSILVNAFSLLWYLEKDAKETRKERYLKNLRSLKILHVFQLGVPLRYASVLNTSIGGCSCNEIYTKDQVKYLKNDLSILRVIETFSESAPQLVIMLAIIFQRGEVELIPFLKAFCSVAALSVSVTMYYRSLRSSPATKAEPSWGSSAVYFLWNLLLIGPRVAAVALFASVFPCYIAAHFLCSWMVLFLCAWRLNTKFTKSAVEKCLYKATVGLIWYFSWFYLVTGRKKVAQILYHIWIVLDIGILCGVWVWQMKKSPPYFHLPIDPIVIFCVVTLLPIVGVVLMLIYYKFCHPTQDEPDGPTVTPKQDDQHSSEKESESPEQFISDNKGMRNIETDVLMVTLEHYNHGFRSLCGSENKSLESPEKFIGVNKRMRNLDANFF